MQVSSKVGLAPWSSDFLCSIPIAQRFLSMSFFHGRKYKDAKGVLLSPRGNNTHQFCTMLT